MSLRGLGSFLAVLAVASGAHAQDPAEGAYVVRRYVEAATPRTVEVASAQGSHHALLGERVRPARAVLASRDNANTRYGLMIEYPRAGHADDCPGGALRLGGRWLASSSWGSSPRVCSFHFELDTALATLAAARFRVPRQDRRPLGEGLSATFSTPNAVYARGEPVPIVITIANAPGAARVLRVVGGRNRGPRNNRFSLRVTRDGQPVPEIEAWDFGGLSTTVAVDPGGSGTVEEQVQRWADLSAPGRYVVECAYETELHPDGFRYEDRRAGDEWDARWTGTVRFEVR